MDSGASGRALLSARNLLGKLLLSRAEWDAAEQHFAADICRAAALGDSLSELRARVNRAIALLSRGSSDEARSLLVEVLERAEARGEAKAVGFALSNLAVLAIEPVALPATVALTVKVAVPALSRSTDAEMLPLPLAGQLDPALAAQVHGPIVKPLGPVSVTVAPVTLLGPLLVATMV